MDTEDYLRELIEKARRDKESESLLRDIIRRSALSAPLQAILEVAETLAAIRARDRETELEKN